MSNRKFLINMFLALIGVLLVIAIVCKLTQPQVERWDYHAVDVGDTQWNIAEEHNPGYTGDIREITYRIKKANGMKDDTVYVGDLIRVPVVGA